MLFFYLGKKEDFSKLEGCRLVELVDTKDKEFLFRRLERELHISNIDNWESLERYLCDLRWLNEKSIILYHSGISSLPDEDLKKYLAILINSVYSQIHMMDRIFFSVVFHPKEKDRLIKLLPFEFNSGKNLIDFQDALRVNISDISDEESLYSEMAMKLSFPEYFGRNWDALYDCLTDMEWAAEQNIVITHNSLDSLPDEILNMYVGVLIDATFWWKYWPYRKGFEPKGFYIEFSPSDFNRVRKAIVLHFTVRQYYYPGPHKA